MELILPCFRQQWDSQKKVLESKQPMDVQMLQSQKRELTMQLDREQSEKQELFLQVYNYWYYDYLLELPVKRFIWW